MRALPDRFAQEDIARSAGQDAANRQMRAEGRDKWTLDDYNLAARVMNETLDQMRGYKGQGVYWSATR